MTRHPRAAPQAGAGATRRASLRHALALALAGPALTLLDLSLRFFLVELGFARRHEGIVIGIGVASCSLALVAAALSHRGYRRAPAESRELAFICSLGAALGAFSAVVIVSMLLPHLYFDAEVPQ